MPKTIRKFDFMSPNGRREPTVNTPHVAHTYSSRRRYLTFLHYCIFVTFGKWRICILKLPRIFEILEFQVAAVLTPVKAVAARHSQGLASVFTYDTPEDTVVNTGDGRIWATSFLYLATSTTSRMTLAKHPFLEEGVLSPTLHLHHSALHRDCLASVL